MADNVFDAYDEAAPTLTAPAPATEDDNPFSAFDGEQPPQPEAPANQPPAPITPVQNMPGVSVIEDPEMRDILDQFAAHNIREGTDKISESRGNSFIDGVTDPQQYLETGKGVVPGAIKFGGTTLKGAGAVKAAAEVNVAKFAHERLAVLDRLERGESAQPQRFGDLTGMASARDATGYASLTPAQRAAERARLERLLTGYTPTPAEQQSLFKAGEKVTEYAKTVLPPAPGYEEAVGRQLGEGIGSLVAGLPAGWLGRIPAAAFFGAGGAGEAVERAIEFDRKEKKAGRPGLTQDQINASALWGVAPGTTDLLPIETLFGRLKIPAPFARLAARAVGRIGGQAFVEGMQEGGQQFLQNLIAQEIYNPEQALGEGVVPNIAMGGGVGAAAQSAKEAARLALRNFAGRRGGSAPGPSPSQAAPTGAPQAAGAPGQALSKAPEAASPAPDAAPAPQIQRDAAPETRAATREQFNQYLALEDRLASIPDDMDAPPDLINQQIDAEEAMVESFRATGLPGDNLARGTRPINSMDDVRRAFDEATPEEIDEFWQGKAVGPAASGADAGAGAAAQGGATQQARAAASAEEGGAGAAPAGAAPALRLEKAASSGGATVYDAMIDDVAHAQISIKLHPKDKAIEVLGIGNDRKQGKLKPEFVGKIKAALAQQFPDYETAFGQEVGERSPLRPAARDLTTDFLRLISGPTPRDQWAKALGVSEDDLMPHVERAIASGLLRVDRNGVVRRNAAAVAEMEPEVEAEGQKIEQAIEAGAGPLLAPGVIEGENVTLTPKAIDKIQELKAIAEEAVAKILPRDVRIEVVDNIAIDRLAHEDELLALRSSKSAKVSEGTEGESDESGLQEDSGEAGQAGDDASQSAGEGEIAAAVGGGGASGASTTEGRILRQESATLRADGSIRAGRVSGKAAASSGLDAETLQPVGTSEFFDAPGLRGVVTAMPVADHAGLARRGAPASEYRLANLTYRLYAPDAPLTEAQLTNFQPNFREGGDFHAPLIWARVSQHMDGTWEVSMVQRIADRESAPKGMANKLYAAIEKDLDIRMSPSGILSEQGLAMWKKRSPESVKWHQWSKHEGYFISPRRIKDNLARIGMDLADIAARPDTDPNKAEDHAIALSERKELIKLWTKLPLEARGSTPNTMFSLRAYHGSPHDFDRFDLSRVGTGEGLASNELAGAYLSSNSATGGEYQFDLGGDAGILYRVDIDAEISDLIDLNKPFSEQSEAVRNRIPTDLRPTKDLEIDGDMTDDGRLSIWHYGHRLALIDRREDGEWIWRVSGIYGGETGEAASKAEATKAFRSWFDKSGPEPTMQQIVADVGGKNAAELMRAAGIKGAFRDVDDSYGGSKTYIIVDESALKITHKNGKAVSAEERQAAVDAMFSLRGGKADQTQTPEFKRWFGDSKVVDEGGKPLRVYHGTAANIEAFDPAKLGEATDAPSSKIGFFFAADPAVASSYAASSNFYKDDAFGRIANKLTGGWYEKANEALLRKLGLRGIAGGGENVLPVHLKIERPFEFDMKGQEYRERAFADIIDQAKRDGHDGVVIRNTFDEGFEEGGAGMTDVYVVFAPEQIKSAIGNRGAFDPNDPRIAFALRGFYSPAIRAAEALGQTNPDAKIISIGARAIEAESRATGKSEKKITIETARHEALEFFLAKGFIKPDEWATLVDVAVDEGWVEAAGVRDPYTKQFGETMDAAQLEDLILKESIMVKYGEYERGNYKPNGLIAKVFKRIKDFRDRLRNSLKSQGFQRWEDIFQKMDAGEMRQRYEARFGRPAEAAQNRVTSKAVPAGGRIAAMTLPGLAQNAPLSPAPAGPTPGRAASAPGSLVDIQRNLRRKLGLTVASGRLDPAAARAAGQAGDKLMGQFDRQTEVIRLRTLQDIDTEAHEVAHALENRYAGLANLQQAHAQELSGVANLTGQSGLSEGFAEFFRLYLTNPPAADAHAPKFRAAFEDFLETQDAQTLQDIQGIQAQYQQWRNASSAGRITAAVKSGVPGGTWEKISAEYDRGGLTRVGGMFWAYLEQVYKSRIDRTNPIRVLVERIARQAEAVNQDIDLSAWRNPQAQARKIPAADGIAYMDITRGVGWENAAGRGSISLRDALSTAFGGTGYEHWTPQQRDDFGAYLIARRGRWLWQRHDMDPARNRGRMANPPQNPQPGDWYFDTMTRQRRVYLRGRWETELTRAPDKHTRADHEQAVADLEAANPQFAVAAQMVYQFNRDLALKRFQAGLDSQEEFDYKNGATDYVPWFRDMTDAIFAGTGVSGRKVQGKFKIRGSYRDFINPVEGIIRQVYDTNREIAVNKPKLLLAQLADGVQGAGKFAEIIPATRMASQEVRVREVLAQAAKAEGLPPEDAKDMIAAVAAMIGDDAVATLFRSEQAGDGRDAILHYMDGGELKMLQIHDDERGIARDILGFFELVRGTPAADSFFGTVSAVVRVPQKAITSSLGFIYRNVIRDSMQAAALQAGYFPIVSNIRTIASNRARAARGEETWGELLARHGGIMGGIGRTDVQQIRQGRIADLRSDTVTLKPWERQFWRQTINPWHEDFWKWAEWSEANARQTLTRISFDRAIADVRTSYPAMPPDQQTFVALETATNRSRDYTDYSRAGDAPSQAFLNRMIMFLNPSLQGPDKMIRALFLAQTNEGRFATAQLIRKKIAPLFNDNLQYQRLTKSEIDALKDAARAWITIAIIAHTHLLLEVFFNDPDDLEDKSKLERATSVSFTINGVDYRIPRGFDVINVTSNAVKAGYESWQREDPTSWSRFRETLWTSLVPAHSNPILDLYIGWRHGKNNFFNSDIEPTYMKGRLPEDRYSAYTSNLSRQVAEGINSIAPFEVSPLMAEYSMTAIGADWARDIMRAYDIADPNKPALRWQEYPFLRAARGLRGTRGAEEFWTLMGKDGSFVQTAASYRDEAVKGKAWSRDDIRKFFDVRVKDEDAKAYAVMLGHYNAEQKRLHPMERAREFARGISGVMRDVASNRIDVPVTSKKEVRAEVSREVRAQALEILGEIGRREYRNALIALKRPGYENREPQPVKPYLNELKTISPEIHKSLIARITNADGSSRVYDYDKVRELWPETRQRLLSAEKRERIIETQGDVEFGDLTARAQGAKAMGIR